ncbi:MAG TPA: class I SAM-dependent methyltransferase [Thermoanaerobaculia bacterium]|nr:class I SAM-dependent methyltransferase [Thermoanaerobaculia bacterium]
MRLPQFLRIPPVYFQPLEQELEPAAQFLSGHLLNAGCGTRDIEPWLRRQGVTRVTRYDIASDDPAVIIGPLESMPFDDGTFDAALCNAVLEHVLDAERAIRELARVVRIGGHLVIAVPFLQPYHASPGDFRRYTADGLAQLGRAAGLEVVQMLPVHSFAQTLGWIVWEYAQEKGGFFRRAMAYTLAFLITRLRSRTDRTLVRNANTFQAVFRRPESKETEVLGTAWRQKPLPAACTSVPTMLVPDELRLLHHLSEDYYRGDGVIVDAGSFLGGSTVTLADGLRRNLRRRRQREEKLIHSFDRFEVEEWTRGIYFPETTRAGESFRDTFECNIAPYAALIDVHAGDITAQEWNGGPIEILFLDVAKHWTVCDHVTWQFFPHLIPGRSIVVQQDYLYHHWTAWLHVTMEIYADYFEYVCDTEVNSVAFRCTRRIPQSVLRRNTVESLTTEEKVALMDRAASRFEGAKREIVLAAKEHFLGLMAREGAEQRKLAHGAALNP